MTAIFPRGRFSGPGRWGRSLASVLLLALLSCNGETSDTTDAEIEPGADGAVSDGTADSGPVILETTCRVCHDLTALSEEPDPGHLAPRDWMATHGEGLLRYAPSIPENASLHFELRWERRGHHPEIESGCLGCHPVYADGRGHSVQQYAAAGRQSAHQRDGINCAGSCHTWLEATHQATRFPDADGTSSTIDVPGRPDELLSAADNDHAKVWRIGYQGEGSGSEQTVKVLAPGCAGCHNFRAERHGEIPSCTQCHAFEGEHGGLHVDHLTWIDELRAENDPSNPDRNQCLYCHNFNDPETDDPDPVYRAGCYNCHLSGHQPLDENSQAHFWPAGE